MNSPEQIFAIPLKDIKISKYNVRQTERNKEIDELANSIKKYGLLQPVVLSGSHGNPPYELIVGQRRFLAHKMFGLENIRAVFCKKLIETDLKILSLMENMHRVELNHADKAEALTSLYLHYKKDIKLVADKTGLSVATVRDYIRIEAQATQKAKDLLKDGKVYKEDVKRAIDAAHGDPEKVNRLFDEMATLSRYEKERAVNYGKSHPESSADEIIEEAQKPKLERTVILKLTGEVDDALNKAEKQLSMARESIAVKALAEWLKENGFLNS